MDGNGQKWVGVIGTLRVDDEGGGNGQKWVGVVRTLRADDEGEMELEMPGIS